MIKLLELLFFQFQTCKSSTQAHKTILNLFFENRIISIDTRRDTVAKSIDVTNHEEGIKLWKEAEVAGCCTARITERNKIKRLVYLCSKTCHNPTSIAEIKEKIEQEKQDKEDISWDNFINAQNDFLAELSEGAQLTGDQKSSWLNAFKKQGYDVTIEDPTKTAGPQLVKNDQGEIIAYIHVLSGMAQVSKTLKGDRKYIYQIADIFK